PRARCSANLLFNSSSPIGSPEELRNTLKPDTHSGKISDVRKSLAGGNEGRTSCVSVVRGEGGSGTGTRRASDLLLVDANHER
ncbi:hypothetical protein BV20DRAFT_989981, partial [Pilatotrama ljubarskyi]